VTITDFIKQLEEKGIHLSGLQIDQFATYYRLLVEWNEKINLTAITEKEDVYLKHFYDSISPAFYFPFSEGEATLCDIGAGAGFPSIPLKICFPNLAITIVDSLNKRIQFLNCLSSELGLSKVRLVHDRAETFGRIETNREAFDIVTARAVAKLSVLSEYCLPLVKKGGNFIALKATSARDEIEAATPAIHTLGGKVVQDHQFMLPKEESKRHIIVIAKTKQTPNKYPRRPGIPSREPLGE